VHIKLIKGQQFVYLLRLIAYSNNLRTKVGYIKKCVLLLILCGLRRKLKYIYPYTRDMKYFSREKRISQIILLLLARNIISDQNLFFYIIYLIRCCRYFQQ
jgi:hypothetical protein